MYKSLLLNCGGGISDVWQKAKESSAVRNQVPGEVQVNDFIDMNGLFLNALFAQLTAGADMSFPIPDLRWNDEVEDRGITIRLYENFRSRVESLVEANYLEMIHDPDPDCFYTPGMDNNTKSIILRVFHSLLAASSDPDQGLFYASSLLRNLINVIEGHLAEVRDRLARENVQGQNLSQALDKAQNDLFSRSPGSLFGKRIYEAYTYAARNLVIHHTRMTIYYKMEDLLMIVRKQFINLANDFKDVFGKTIDI